MLPLLCQTISVRPVPWFIDFLLPLISSIWQCQSKASMTYNGIHSVIGARAPCARRKNIFALPPTKTAEFE